MTLAELFTLQSCTIYRTEDHEWSNMREPCATIYDVDHATTILIGMRSCILYKSISSESDQLICCLSLPYGFCQNGYGSGKGGQFAVDVYFILMRFIGKE